MPRLFILIKKDLLILTPQHFYRRYLLRPFTRRQCSEVFLLGSQPKDILLLSSDLPLPGDILCRLAHGIRMVLVRQLFIGKPPANGGVEYLRISIVGVGRL